MLRVDELPAATNRSAELKVTIDGDFRIYRAHDNEPFDVIP